VKHLSRLAAPAAALASMAVVTGLATPALAATPDEVVTGLVSPLSLAVAQDGTVLVSQNFAGVLSSSASEDPVFSVDGAEVGAVSVEGGTVTFATTPRGPGTSKLWTADLDGANLTEVADLGAYEAEVNPDGTTAYGVKLSRSCRSQVGKRGKPFLAGRGGVESHPYATYVDGTTTYVADAAGNSILAVEDGEISTVATLPAVPIEITRTRAKVMHLPGCAVGRTFRAEGVPTDVEMGPDGNLYVTSLPGGPEDPAMGSNGGVYRVELGTGTVTSYASGLTSPVGLAIGPDGTAYVSMLFAGVVLQQPFGGAPTVFAEVPFPGDVELRGGQVYVTETDLMNDGSTPPAGKVLRFTPGA
jgi:hypothetical protein